MVPQGSTPGTRPHLPRAATVEAATAAGDSRGRGRNRSPRRRRMISPGEWEGGDLVAVEEEEEERLCGWKKERERETWEEEEAPLGDSCLEPLKRRVKEKSLLKQ